MSSSGSDDGFSPSRRLQIRYSVRGSNLKGKLDEVWYYNNYKDRYTREPKRVLLQEGKFEIDHIIEVQIGDHIWHNLTQQFRKDGELVPVEPTVKKIWNAPFNLNATNYEVNLQKANAVMKWKQSNFRQDLGDCLEDAGMESALSQNIIATMQHRGNSLVERLHELANDEHAEFSMPELQSEVIPEFADWLRDTLYTVL